MSLRNLAFAALVVWALWLAPAAARAANPDEPHPHQGVLTPYAGAPPRPTLTAADLAELAAGEPVLKQEQTASGTGAAGRGIGIQDVHADPATIWARITDYGAYPRMVDHVKECQLYDRAGDHFKVRFVIGAPLISIEYFIDHTFHQEQGWMTWRLDYTRHSDFDDTVGFWRVDPLPDKPGWSRVFYSADVKAAGWVPPPIEQAFAKIGLSKATAWVKRESEAAAGAPTGAASAGG